MGVSLWMGRSRVARGLAAGSVAVALGGLTLARAARAPAGVVEATGRSNVASFAGPGARGTLAISQALVPIGGERRVYAEIRLRADEAAVRSRAPLSLAVVLDTSGSMGGDKLERAKAAAARLVRDMHDDDEIAVVRYASDATTVQPLARVGAVRQGLVEAIGRLEPGGGTAIPLGLGRGLGELAGASPGRVRRVVLVSDGLDATRVEAERLARESFERGTTVSSLGVGLDFDEAYMSALSRAGHGNFAFDKDASALATFLRRELNEASATAVDDAVVRVRQPEGLSLVRGVGADVRALPGGWAEVRLGALFAGDERRALLELGASLGDGAVAPLGGEASWRRVGGGRVEATVPRLEVAATADERAAEASRDAAVLASAASVLASERQLAATEAYARGDREAADALLRQSVDDLRRVERAAPAPVKAALGRQLVDAEKTRADFASAAPGSEAGRERAKASYQRGSANAARAAY
jgi:Ca-activated chloride channel family protein